jgi:hypothetical protein
MSTLVLALVAGTGPEAVSGEVAEQLDHPPSLLLLLRGMPKAPPWITRRTISVERELLVLRARSRHWKCTVVYTEELNLFGLQFPLNTIHAQVIYVDLD